mgnify:FL=1|tara:strand:- start:945 stop:1196 length:252 start_codon:yes stop_codon:yes gene_type:complete
MNPYKEIREIDNKLNELHDLKNKFDLEYLDDPKYANTVFDDEYLINCFDLFSKELETAGRWLHRLENIMLSEKFTNRYQKEFS